MLDATTRLRRRLAGRLHSNETVSAAVSVHRPGTTAAALGGGAGGAVAAVSGTGVTFDDAPADSGDRSVLDAGPYLYLVLTSHRVLVLRRSVFGRAKDVVLDASLDEVQAIEMKPNSSRIELRLSGDRTYAFETPKAPKFLPEVYRRLPALLAEARKRDQ